jgi:hypothetical protein
MDIADLTGIVSSPKANTVSGQPLLLSVRCEPDSRFSRSPILRGAVNAVCLETGQLRTPRGRSRRAVRPEPGRARGVRKHPAVRAPARRQRLHPDCRRLQVRPTVLELRQATGRRPQHRHDVTFDAHRGGRLQISNSTLPCGRPLGSHPAPGPAGCDPQSVERPVLVPLRHQGHPVCGLRDDRRDGLRLRHADGVTPLGLDDGRTSPLGHRALRVGRHEVPAWLRRPRGFGDRFCAVGPWLRIISLTYEFSRS